MSSVRPPKLAAKLFDWYCGFAKVDDLRGDLEEIFQRNMQGKPAWRAKLIYWRQVLALLFSYAIQKRKRDAQYSAYSTRGSWALVSNYFKVSLRTLARQKHFTIINIVGLAIGMSVSLLLISLWSYVSGYDKFHARADEIWRVTTRTQAERVDHLASTPVPLADKLLQEFVSEEDLVRINRRFTTEIDDRGETLTVSGYYVDPPFLNIFTFPLISGNKATALSRNNSIVINETIALKLFGRTDALGQTIKGNDGVELEVTGIIKDVPKNSHMQFDVLVPYAMLPKEQVPVAEQWTNFRNNYVYLVLPEEKRAHLEGFLASAGVEVPEGGSSVRLDFELQRLRDIVPGTGLSNQIGPDWGYDGLIVFATLCLLILLPACFNYTNISIARALKRSKEFGLRKTLGSMRRQIFFQFITETVIICLLALAGSLLIFFLIRGEFQHMLVEASTLDLSLTLQSFVLFLVFALLAGFISGVLPALYFSKINPIQALKNQHTIKLLSGKRLRTALVVFQFALSLGFIVSIVVVSKQYRYALNFDLGFQQENILDVKLQGADPRLLQTEFSQLSSVQSVSMSSDVMGMSYSATSVRKPDTTDSTEVFQMFIDENYISNMGLVLLAGQTFGNVALAKERVVVVNEEFVKYHRLGTPQEALGKIFIVDSLELEIAGVVRNFHFMGLIEPVRSFFFRNNPGQFRYANVKILTNDMASTFVAMETSWNKFSNGKKMESKFFEDEIEESYISFKVMLKLCGFLGLLALSISCLGLLGMVMYSTENRIKEVSIRKVMGASATNLSIMLSKGYLKLMLIAAAFALPLTTILFDVALSKMQYYRVAITVWDAGLSLLILLILGIATMAWQTVKTASANPADTLKYE